MRRRSRTKKRNIVPKMYLNESPSVISLMSSVITSGGSLDAAVRKVAAEGPKNTARLFRDVVSSVDCRLSEDIRTSLLALISEIPDGLSSYRRALFMTVSASDAKSQTEKVRIMDEASKIVLEGIKLTGESYVSKLQFPSMAVFGIGIMVPMIILSLAPMASINNLLPMPLEIEEGVMNIVILFLVPLIVVSVILSIKDKNPFMDTAFDPSGGWRCLFGLIALPLAHSLMQNGTGIREVLTVSIVIGSVAVYLSVSGLISKERRRLRKETAIRGSLYDLGNRMVTGENFDSALIAALSQRKETKGIADALTKEYVLCRGDVNSAIRLCISPISADLSDLLCRIGAASYRDIRDAGRMAVSIAHQLQNEDHVRRDMKNKLQGIMDMMNGTAALFAPLILGMSMMMMSPLSEITGVSTAESSFVTLTIYITELSILMSVFTALLTDRLKAVNVVHRISMVLPVAMVILYVCSSITI